MFNPFAVSAKRLYLKSELSKTQIAKLVNDGFISENEYKEITGEQFAVT